MNEDFKLAGQENEKWVEELEKEMREKEDVRPRPVPWSEIEKQKCEKHCAKVVNRKEKA